MNKRWKLTIHRTLIVKEISMLRDVTDSTFEDEVLGSKGVVLVDI